MKNNKQSLVRKCVCMMNVLTEGLVSVIDTVIHDLM